MIEPHDAPGHGPAHGVLLWRWLAFDPPMRDPGARGCRQRTISCTTCGCGLGTTDDPVDAVMMAWRHRRELRTTSHMGVTTPSS